MLIDQHDIKISINTIWDDLSITVETDMQVSVGISLLWIKR